jgi:hypothetical protein
MILIEGGGFSLLKGTGTLAGRAFGGSLSNKLPMNQSISAWDRPVHDREFIRSETYEQRSKAKFKILLADGSRLGSASHEHL